MAAEDLTVRELLTYVDAYNGRMEDLSYWGYNTAWCMASMLLAKEKPEPWDVYPGWIARREQSMSNDDILAACLAWCQ